MKPCVILAIACCLASPALAGGPIETPVEPDPMPAPAVADSDWTGFYVGISLLRGTFSDDGGVTDGGTDGLGLQAGYLRDLGTFVIGGELAYSEGDYDAFPTNEWNALRGKLIGGFDTGRVLPYGFVGLSEYDVTGVSEFSDTATIYGLGAKLAVTPSISTGLEYLIERKDDYAGTGGDLENDELSLRLDYRF